MRQRDGIDAVVLGGTELPLILRGVTQVVPFLDTTAIHIDAVVELALAN
jgi:aspartate racemase